MGLFDGTIIQKGKDILGNVFGLNDDEYLDEKFSTITEMFNQLDLDHDGKNGIIHENSLDILYHSVTGNQSAIDFSSEYGGADKQINNIDEFTQVLQYLEGLDDKDVFKLVDSDTKTIDDVPITSPIPQDVIDKYQLDNATGFYHKVAYANGLPVLASEQVSEQDIINAVNKINKILSHHPNILQQLVNTNHRIVLLGGKPFEGQFPSDIPELKNSATDTYVYSNNIITAPGETETESFDILLHETAHAIDIGALSVLYPTFHQELQALYEKEIATKFQDETHTRLNKHEFWAGIVAAYYEDPNASYKNLTDDFKNYAPEAYNFVHKYFGDPTKTPAVIPV